MTKKEILLVALVVILGGVYVCFFTDCFRPRIIRIEHSARPLREAWAGGQRVNPAGARSDSVTFSLHNDYRLTSVQVVSAAEARTNQYARRFWHLVCTTGTPPVNAISYGNRIPGMTSSVPGAVAEPLQPGVDYRLLVEAGSFKGSNDFRIAGQAAVRR
jgi:hypothetical protein